MVEKTRHLVVAAIKIVMVAQIATQAIGTLSIHLAKVKTITAATAEAINNLVVVAGNQAIGTAIVKAVDNFVEAEYSLYFIASIPLAAIHLR